MKKPGVLAVLRFPSAQSSVSKRRPVLLVTPTPGRRAWLVCALSTRLHLAVEGFDEIVSADDKDFETSGLKVNSVIRVGRLAVVPDERLEGAIGEIASDRLGRIRETLQRWIVQPPIE